MHNHHVAHSVSGERMSLSKIQCLYMATCCNSHAGPASNKVLAKPKGKAVAHSKKKSSVAAKKPPAKKPPAKKPTARQTQSDEDVSDGDIEVSVKEQETQDEPESSPDEQADTSQAAKGKKGSKRAAASRPGPGSVKAGGIAGDSLLSCQIC